MTETPPLPSSLMSNAKKSRYLRAVSVAAERRLQPRDLQVLRHLFLFRWAKTAVLLLIAQAFTEKPDEVRGKNAPAHDPTGLSNFVRRLTDLWEAGYVSRFKANPASYLPGSRWPVYTIETGRAAIGATFRTHRLTLTDEQKKQMDDHSAASRERTVQALAAALVPSDWVKSLMHQNEDAALRLVSGESTLVAHTLLGSDFLAVVIFGAYAHGAELVTLLPDKFVDLTAAIIETGKDRSGQRVERTVRLPIKPDAFFVIGWEGKPCHGFALEAETGSSSRAAVKLKIERYLKLFRAYKTSGIAEIAKTPLHSFRVIVHCRFESHARLVLDVISELQPQGTGLFVVSTSDDINVGDIPGAEQWGRDHFLKNLPTASGQPLYTFLANRITSPVFRQVVKRGDQDAITKQVALLASEAGNG